MYSVLVAATEPRGRSLRLGHHARGAVATDVEEAPECPLLVADEEDRLAGDGGGDERARPGELVGPSHQVPALAEDRPPLPLGQLRAPVPATGDRPRSFERERGIEGREEPLERGVHAPCILAESRWD